MKIGIVSDSLSHLPFNELLKVAQDVGVEGIEFNTGNWSTSPHLSLQTLITNRSAREDFEGKVQLHGLEIISFNCNGNQLHPVNGAQHDKVVRDTIRLSGAMGLSKVCLMSGLPGAAESELHPNWIVSSWPPENREILKWQWKEKLIPYWKELSRFANDHGVSTLAIEMHGNQLVYSPHTLVQLRDQIGESVCANLDPSHLMWMGADPIASVDYLGSTIRHVHGKDTFLNSAVQATRSLLENGPLDNIADRSWSHCTLGYGHGHKWWSDFFYRLALNGYDGWVSIEHEDMNLSRLEGLNKAIQFLRQVSIRDKSDYAVQAI